MSDMLAASARVLSAYAVAAALLVLVLGCGGGGGGDTGGAGGADEPASTWKRFTDELAKAEEVVDDLVPDPVRETGILPVPEGAVYDRTPQDDRTRSEGFRQLTRLLRLGLWSIGEYGFGQMGDEHSLEGELGVFTWKQAGMHKRIHPAGR